MRTKHPLSLALISLLLMFCGCQGSADPDAMLAQATDNNVKRVSRMYTVFQMRNSMVGPKDEEELKDFILGHSPARLARIGIEKEKIDDIFVSERDGEKLTIRYGLKLKDSNSSIPIVFENKGDNDVRRVGFANAYVREISSPSEYEKLLSGAEDNVSIEKDHD